MRQRSFFPKAYELQRNLIDGQRSSRSVSREKKPTKQRRGSQSSKYSFDKQKEVTKKANQGDKTPPKKRPVSRDSDSGDLGRSIHESVDKKVNQINKMSKNVQGKLK